MPNMKSKAFWKTQTLPKGKMFQIVAVALIALTLLAVFSSLAQAQSPRVVEIDIKAFMFGYDPSEISVNQGDTVVIRLSSLDVSHGL